ncbi:hypothetical protein AAVH_36742, partial [Aphelenchoides avenae]
MSDVVLCDLLAESGLKTQWLVETYQTPSSEFKRALGSGKVDAKDISEGEGYASKVYQREENTREVEQLSLAHFHDIECSFSEAFKGAEGQPLPKVWYTRKPGTSELGVILIEDLSGLGCKKGFMKALNAQQLRNIAREYAFHLCADKNVKAAIDVIPSNTTVNLFAENGEKTLATLKAAIRECKEGKLLHYCRFKRHYFMVVPSRVLGQNSTCCDAEFARHVLFETEAA